MSADWNDRRMDLLQALERMGSAGRAEGESEEKLRTSFYRVPEHVHVLDPGVVLAVGPRGAGKTEIARVLTDAKLASAVVACTPKTPPK